MMTISRSESNNGGEMFDVDYCHDLISNIDSAGTSEEKNYWANLLIVHTSMFGTQPLPISIEVNRDVVDFTKPKFCFGEAVKNESYAGIIVGLQFDPEDGSWICLVYDELGDSVFIGEDLLGKDSSPKTLTEVQWQELNGWVARFQASYPPKTKVKVYDFPILLAEEVG